MGLTIGTSVKPQQIGLIFGVVVMPITFLGCVYYPWAALEHIRWLQIGVLVNPIVYMSEGLRSALTPTLPHMPHALILSMLTFFLVLLTWLGIRGFPAPRDRLELGCKRPLLSRAEPRRSAGRGSGRSR